MAANIDMSNGKANIAFRGTRQDVWHHLGQEMPAGADAAAWAKAAGLDWQAELVPALAYTAGIAGAGETTSVEDRRFVVRSDTAHVLGYVSDRYKPVQPAEVLDWFQQYIAVDDRFALDVAGSLKQGEIIWATAIYNGGIDVAGDNHVARLLMTTTFDGTGATINKGTMTRVVCNNTLDAALGSDRKVVVKTRHSTRFNPERVGAELAVIAGSFERFKAMGDAMGSIHMAKADVSKFFKAVLEIPFDAPKDDVSTRKLNQFADLNHAYSDTVREGTQVDTAWCALNAVTRYVDHDRSTRGGNGMETRFLSSQFGSGAQMKERAVAVLCEMTDSDLLKAVAAKTSESMSDLELLRAVAERTAAGN